MHKNNLTYREIIQLSLNIALCGLTIITIVGILGYLLFLWPTTIVCGVITLVAILLVFESH